MSPILTPKICPITRNIWFLPLDLPGIVLLSRLCSWSCSLTPASSLNSRPSALPLHWSFASTKDPLNFLSVGDSVLSLAAKPAVPQRKYIEGAFATGFFHSPACSAGTGACWGETGTSGHVQTQQLRASHVSLHRLQRDTISFKHGSLNEDSDCALLLTAWMCHYVMLFCR